eukprot:11225488-Ditylum_brightwellii.AAC.1
MYITAYSIFRDTTQGISVGNDGSLPGEISIHDFNENDDDCSLPTLSDSELSLTTETYKELEDDSYSNQNYLKHFSQVPPSYSNCPPMPGKSYRYVFLFEYDYDTDIDNMSKETHNKYVTMKYNCKAIKDMGEDDPDKEITSDRYLHEWN